MFCYFNIFSFVDIKELIKVASTMGFSLDVEALRICLNEVDEVGHQIKLKIPFLLIENHC